MGFFAQLFGGGGPPPPATAEFAAVARDSAVSDLGAALIPLMKARDNTPGRVRDDLPVAMTPKSWSLSREHMGWVYGDGNYTDSHPGALGLPYFSLSAMSRVDAFAALLHLRTNQVAECSKPVTDPYSLGCRVRKTDQRQEPTKKETAEADRIMALIQRAGYPHQRGGFEAWLRAIVPMSLTYDQATSEILDTVGRASARRVGASRKGFAPAGFVWRDATTIRLAHPTRKEIEAGMRDPDGIQYVQWLDQQVTSQFQGDQLMFGVRNPSLSVYAQGYGRPELESLIVTITNYVNAITFNGAAFTTGIQASTLIALMANMDDAKFNSWKRSLEAQLYGPAQQRRTVITQLNPGRGDGIKGEDLKTVQLSQTNRDMEFSNWINWSLKMVCAMMGTDPAELSFVFGNEGQSSSLGQRGPEERIKASKDRGLRPILRAVARWINEWIVWPINEEYTFEFAGLDAMNPEEAMKLTTQAVGSFMTLGEARAKHDLPLLDFEEANNWVLNPSFMNAMQAQMAQDQDAGDEGSDVPGLPGSDPEVEGNMDTNTAFDEITKAVQRTVYRGIQSGRIFVPKTFRAGDRWILRERPDGTSVMTPVVDSL